MPTPTYVPLATVTLGTTATSVTFSSIPATYRDLVLVIQANQSSGGAVALYMLPNGAAITDGDTVFLGGNGTSASSYTSDRLNIGDLVTGEGQIHRVEIFDYSATDKHKTYLARFDRAAYATLAINGRWRNTNAITSLQIVPDSGRSFASGGTFNLYGIAS